MTDEPTDAQEDALARLRKRHGSVELEGFDLIGRLLVLLPGAEPERRRRRAISKTGVVERTYARD